MNNKEAIEVLRKIDLCVPTGVIDPSDFYLALALAIKALEDRPQGDLISREALKEEVRKHVTGNNLDVFVAKNIMCLIDNAPAVEYTFEEAFQKTVCDNKLYCPNKRPEGEWITIRDEKYGDNVKCPFCGKEIAGTDLNFCVKCGADMRKGSTESLDYQRAVEDTEYCERYEPTYNPNDGSM